MVSKAIPVSRAIPVVGAQRGSASTPADAREWTNVLAEVPLFAGLSVRQRRKLAAVARIRRFADGAPFIRAGEPGEGLFVLLDGEVSVRAPGRAPLTLGIGSVIGELALLDGGARTANVVAKGPVVTLTITGKQFRKLLHSEPSIAVALAEELARRLRTAHATA